jgi:ABC-type transport system substrate-binding protein
MAKRRFSIFILILAGVAFFPGWQMFGWDTAEGAESSSAKASSRPMVWAVKTEGRGLDPHQFDYDYDQKPQRASLEPLMEYKVMPDRSVKIVGILAESWKGSADAKVWTFQLRKGVKFHDNTPWNAQAAKWNFERLFALNKVPATRIPKNAWPDKGGIEALDDLTLRITLKSCPLYRDPGEEVHDQPGGRQERKEQRLGPGLEQ